MIRKVLENKDRSQNSSEKVYPTEEILGDMKKVKEYAAFGLVHKVDNEVIRASVLMDYCNKLKFTPEELEAFKLGLSAFPKLFEDAEADTKSYLIEAENKNREIKNKKSVG